MVRDAKSKVNWDEVEKWIIGIVVVIILVSSGIFN